MGVLLKKVICNVFSYECCEWYVVQVCVCTHSHRQVEVEVEVEVNKRVETYFDIHDM